MARITSIKTGKDRGKRINIFLDGKLALKLEAETVVKNELKAGQELSSNQIEKLRTADHSARCFKVALNYLNYRPRSEQELKERLQQRGFDHNCVAKVIAELKEQGTLDDTAFARFWKENRETFSPRSQWLTKLELKQKGLTADIIDPVISDMDDDSNAYRAAMSKAGSIPRSDYQSFRRRLGGYLQRRGFNYGVIDRTVRQIWQERGKSSS